MDRGKVAGPFRNTARPITLIGALSHYALKHCSLRHCVLEATNSRRNPAEFRSLLFTKQEHKPHRYNNLFTAWSLSHYEVREAS